MQDYLLEIHNHAGRLLAVRDSVGRYIEKKNRNEEMSKEEEENHSKNVEIVYEETVWIANQLTVIFEKFEPFLNFSRYK